MITLICNMVQLKTVHSQLEIVLLDAESRAKSKVERRLVNIKYTVRRYNQPTRMSNKAKNLKS